MARKVFLCLLATLFIVTVLGDTFDQNNQDDEDDFVERVRRAVSKNKQSAKTKSKKTASKACSAQDLKGLDTCCKSPVGNLLNQVTLFDGKKVDPTTVKMQKGYTVHKLMNSNNKVNYQSKNWFKWMLTTASYFNEYFEKNSLLNADGTVKVEETIAHIKLNLGSSSWATTGSLDALGEACRSAGKEMPNKQSDKMVKKATKTTKASNVYLYAVNFIQCIHRKAPENCPDGEKNDTEACTIAIKKANECDKDGGVIDQKAKKAAKLKASIGAAKPADSPSY